MKLKHLLAVMLVLVVLAAACSAPGDTVQQEPAATMQDDTSSDEMMSDESHDDEMMDESTADEAMDDDMDDSMDDSMAKESDDSMMDDESHEDEMMEEDSMADDSMMDEDDAHDDAMMDDDEMMDDEGHEDSMMDEGESHDDGMMEGEEGGEMMDEEMASPAWFDATLTDVNSDQSFTINDYHGKVVLVETLAVWCSNCLRQQQQVQALLENLGMEDDLVVLGLDIDTNETAGILLDHSTSHGFDWLYAVAPRDVAREIGQLYGDQFLNPPSTPMLIVDRHGEAHPLPFGIKSADDLQAALEPFLNESM